MQHARMNTLTQDTLLAWMERDRQARGWTYDELARELGIPVREIYRWKKGTEISQSNLWRIFAAFGWKIDRPVLTPEPVGQIAASSRKEVRTGNGYFAQHRIDLLVPFRLFARQSANEAKSAESVAA